jgi:spoIIIJ-associated protein
VNGERRIFWGRSLAQAVAKAARYYQLPPEELAWRRHEKRHGFVRHPRAALVEVDPLAPRRTAPVAEAPSPPSTAPSAAGPGGRSAPPARRAGPERPAPPRAAPARPAAPAPPRPIVAERNEVRYEAPDEESEQAALEAVRRLARLAGIAGEPAVARGADRFEIELGAAAGAVGSDLLDDLEHLLPRAILTLSGRRVRAAVDCGGRRRAREAELRALARASAEEVRRSGRSATLGPLPPAERRVVHLALEGDPTLATESVGDGHQKKVRIFLRTSE